MSVGLRALVFADDLTGAADTGIQFKAVGSPVYLVSIDALSPRRLWIDAAGGLSVDTASRHLSVEGAARSLRRGVSRTLDLHPQWVYKKIDSCLRGNLGAEIDVLLDTLEFDAALVAPALPAQGRVTLDGVHLIHGVPLAETQLARDPLAPVASSSVAEVLARQSRYPVGSIRIRDFDADTFLQRAVRRERRRGSRLIVCDASEQCHLDQIASLLVRGADRVLPVGSAGLAYSLVRRLSSDHKEERLCSQSMERLLVICGTGSQVTHRQVDVLLDRCGGIRCELDPSWLVTASDVERRRRASELLDAWRDSVLALTVRALRPGAPAVSPESATAALNALAELAAWIVRGGLVDGLVLSGGETAAAFCRATGGEAIELVCEPLPGLVLGRWVGGAADGLPVVTKAGAFGQERTLAALYEQFSGRARS